MRIAALLIAWLLAACSASTAAPSTSSRPGAPLASTPSPSPADTVATEGEPIPIGSVLPTELGGVTLHTFAVGQDILDRLAEELGVAPNEIEAAYVSEHGARFIQMYAIRLPETSGTSLAAAWSVTAYPPEVDDVVVSDQMIAGSAVTVVHAPGAAARLGTFYLLPQGETLVVVQALDPDVAAEAIGSLP